jgi:hypothetical protein
MDKKRNHKHHRERNIKRSTNRTTWKQSQGKTAWLKNIDNLWLTHLRNLWYVCTGRPSILTVKKPKNGGIMLLQNFVTHLPESRFEELIVCSFFFNQILIGFKCGKVLQEYTSDQILVRNYSYMYHMQFWAPVPVFLSPEYICIMYSHKRIFSVIQSLCSLVKYEEYKAGIIEYRLWVYATARCIWLRCIPFHKLE